MASLESGPRAARRHPLVVACLAALAARGLGLVLHYFSHDPSGNEISASPFDSLLVVIPYHGWVLVTGAAVLLLLWKLLPPARPAVTALGIVLAPLAVAIGQADLAMQWFIGQRFSPSVGGTYVGGSMLSWDVLGPVLAHPWYLTIGAGLIAAPLVPIGWSLLRARRRLPLREPGWALVGTFVALAGVCRIALSFAYGHQLDVSRPPELLFAYRWIHPKDVPAPADTAAAIAELRAQMDPPGTVRWLDPAYPVVRAAPTAPNRFLAGAAPSVRPDVFVFAVESLRGADLGYVPGNYPHGGSPTPHLDALARSGVVFSRYISTGNPSPRGFFGINTGVWDHRESFIISGSTATEFDALPLRLRRAGYFNLAVWGANPSFDNQMYWANRWFDRIRAPVPSMPLTIVHSEPDDRVFDQLIEEVAAHDALRPEQPIFAYVANAGTHEPYEINRGTALPDSVVRAIAGEKDIRRRYRMVLAEYDAEIGRFLDFLRTRAAARPHVVVVVGDHSDLAGDTVPPDLRGQPHDAAEWTAALIAGPEAWIGPPRVETFPAGHADLMPTLLGLIGDRGPTIAMGTDLFADVPPERRTALSNSGWGYRLDRDGWTLIVKRLSPDQIYTGRSFDPIANLHPGLEGSPFTAEDARRLWESQNTWSWLIEHNRVWRASLLDREAPVRPAAAPSPACGSSTPSAGGASRGCPTGSRSSPRAGTPRAPTH